MFSLLLRIVEFVGSRTRQFVVLAFDGAIAAACLWLAMVLRFDGALPDPYATTLPAFTVLLVACRLLANFLLRLHQWSFRFSGLADATRVGLSGAMGTALFLGTLFLVRHPGPPRSVVVLELLLSSLAMVTMRFSPRLAQLYVHEWARTRRDDHLRTVIVGAGAAGEMLLRDLNRNAAHGYHVVGFVDDDPARWTDIVGGKTVLGGIDDLPMLVARHRIEQVLIAIPRIAPQRIREILTLCGTLKLRFKILPVSFVYLQDRAASAAIQDLSPEDLLPREPVTFSQALAPTPLAVRTALVTGAAGSIGSEICEQLLRAGLGHLVMVDVNENGLYLMQRRFERDYPGATVVAEVANIRDALRVRALFESHRPQDVFHAAAHKHVPLLEDAPCEAVKNNVLGTINVAESAHATYAEHFVYISTDKAVRPTSVMGATKRVGEGIVRSIRGRSRTRFCAVRFGNVLGSAGSVVPIFREQIARGGPVTVTSPDVRRFFMTTHEAVALVLQAAYGDYGELCVLDMGEPIRILDLARHMITMSGQVPDFDVRIEIVGLRPGEKLFEELLTEEEETTRGVERKIFVVDGPPPEGLEDWVEELLEAAAAEQPNRVVHLLQRLVPSYTPAARKPYLEPVAVSSMRG